MASDDHQPEDFLIEFLARAKKRQAKLEEDDSTLQPKPKIYHAERIITSNDDESPCADNLPAIVEEENENLSHHAEIIAEDVVEEGEDDDDDGDSDENSLDVKNITEEQDEFNLHHDKLSTIEDEDECEPLEEKSINKEPSILDEGDPLDLSEYLDDGPILYRDEPCDDDKLEYEAPKDMQTEDQTSKKDLKYSMSIYRKENKHKPANTPITVENKPTSGGDTKANKEALITSYEDRIREVTNVIKQTGRALDLCYEDPKRRGTDEHLEFEKLLLTSSFRQLVYSNEIAKMRQPKLGRQPSQDGTTGTVILSLIQLQLTNEFLQSTAEEKVLHCFLCLASCGPEIQATELITSRRIRTSGRRKICFNERLVFQNVPTNFQLFFEVYELVEYPKNKKDLFFAPLTPSKRSTKHPLQTLPSERKTAFKKIGMLQIQLDQCQKVSFTLNHVPEPGSIFGIVNMDITLKPVHTVVKKGMLHFLTESNEYPDWIRRWFVLQDGQLRYWRQPEDESGDPIDIIDLHRCNCEKVSPCSLLDPLYRINSFLLYTSRQVRPHEKDNLLERVHHNFKIIKHQFATDSKDERNSWSEALNFAIDTIRRWEGKSVNVMDDATIKKIMTEPLTTK